MEVGDSILEEDKVEVALEVIEAAAARGVDLRFPADLVIAEECREGVPTRIVKQYGIPEGWLGLDIGPETVKSFAECLAGAGTIFWNGPMGVFEISEFAGGTLGVAREVASSRAFSVVGGGDSVAAVQRLGVHGGISHLSTGGGAALEFLAGKSLPGIEALTDREEGG